jgi:uncharacterized membrane protein YeaQ/YmgE (transglycosylase-associated protein family)
MDLLITIVIGGVIGWLASLVMKTGAQMGILANVIVGIVGSWLGGWLAVKLDLIPSDGIGRFLVGVGGAVLLIWVLKILKVFK